MANQFGIAKLMLGRCPSCYYNFRSIFCYMTCGIDHSRFLTVTQTGNSSKYSNETTVEEIQYRMADDFGQRIVDSCRFVSKFFFGSQCWFRFVSSDVLFPGGNQHSLDTMCNEPYDKCTKESFMKYLGVVNPQVPFPIYIEFINDTSDPSIYYNQTTFTCDQALVSRYENRSACACLVNSIWSIIWSLSNL